MKRVFWGILIVPTLIWLMTGDFLNSGPTYFSFRSVFTQCTGILAIFSMSVCLVLAARINWIENLLNGLDKEYRLHKWLGITALITSLLHFILAKGTKWAVGWGWLIKPERTGGTIERTPVEAWLRTWRSLAEVAGEYVFYISLVLLVIALIKLVPYHFFVKFHKVLAIGYLVLVAHSIVLMTFSYWSTLLGVFMALTFLVGSIAAILTLFNLNRHKRQVDGVIQSIEEVDLENKHLSITLKVSPLWAGHKAGQFAFIQFEKKEGYHPFTIASCWDKKTHLMTFVIKELGDYTSSLKQNLKIGQNVKVEGPYGRFIFNNETLNNENAPQIWVGAGIGITPFLAALEERAYENIKAPHVDMFYCIHEMSAQRNEQLKALAQKASVTLHIFDSKKGRLNSSKIKELVKGWKQSSIWFCGPSGLAKTLQHDFTHSGVFPKNFHLELFDFR